MARKNAAFTECNFETAEDLWAALSPAGTLLPCENNWVFRGHGDASWQLTPSILRQGGSPAITPSAYGNASNMVFQELAILGSFISYCDAVGIPIPADSPIFRKSVANTQTADRYYIQPSLWPHSEILDLMAMAQHHGVPTRLLDWSDNPYIAAYFAASGAVGQYANWSRNSRLAVWALNTSTLGLHPQITMHRVPGSISSHVAAQSGLFSVHRHSGNRGGPFEIESFEYFLDDIPSPLVKLTLPVFESVRLMRICKQIAITAARAYPNADGAGKAVLDDLKMQKAADFWNVTEVLVRF